MNAKSIIIENFFLFWILFLLTQNYYICILSFILWNFPIYKYILSERFHFIISYIGSFISGILNIPICCIDFIMKFIIWSIFLSVIGFGIFYCFILV